MNKDKALESVDGDEEDNGWRSSKFYLDQWISGYYGRSLRTSGYIHRHLPCYPGHNINRSLEADDYGSHPCIGSCRRHCRHTVLQQVQKAATKIFQQADLSGIMEFFTSDADRRCFMYFSAAAWMLYDILSSVMLLFYGLTLVNVSKFTYANIASLGYAFYLSGSHR